MAQEQGQRALELATIHHPVQHSVLQEKLRPLKSLGQSLLDGFFDNPGTSETYEGLRLGQMGVTTEGFAKLTEIVKEIATKCCQGRLVSTLEGGYDLAGLAASVESHIRVLMR